MLVFAHIISLLIALFQRSVVLDLYIPRSTQYILFVQYHSPQAMSQQEVDVSVERRGRDNMKGALSLPACPYRFVTILFYLCAGMKKCLSSP